MNGAIPLKVRRETRSHTIGIGNQALLFELQTALDKLAATGQSTQIDLKSLPMAPDEYEALKAFLGQGELDLELDIDGPTRIRETALAGVWWVQHVNGNGRVLSEVIEVNRFPEFLAAADDAVRRAARELLERLQGA